MQSAHTFGVVLTAAVTLFAEAFGQRCLIRPLLLGGGPPTVAGLVVPVTIDSIERGARWAFTYIGEEYIERLPRWSDGDPSVAVPSRLSSS